MSRRTAATRAASPRWSLCVCRPTVAWYASAGRCASRPAAAGVAAAGTANPGWRHDLAVGSGPAERPPVRCRSSAARPRLPRPPHTVTRTCSTTTHPRWPTLMKMTTTTTRSLATGRPTDSRIHHPGHCPESA